MNPAPHTLEGRLGGTSVGIEVAVAGFTGLDVGFTGLKGVGVAAVG